MYILASALIEIYFIFKFLPATDVAFEGFSSRTMYFVSMWMTLVGLYLYIRGKVDYMNTPYDYYGFGFIKHLNSQGTEFPLPYKMKRLNHTSLMCRHLVASGMLHILIGSLLYGPISYGRLLVVFLHFAFVLIGISGEERQFIKNGGFQYRQFMLEVPSQVIPDYRVLLYTDQQVSQVRNNIHAASKVK